MVRISDELLERVKRETDLVALVQSRGIVLSKHGTKDWIGMCPFHGDKKSPNLIVSPAKGLFHCMACGKAGNPIQFVQIHDGVSFRHAFELLDKGGSAAFASRPLLKNATVPLLPCPLGVEVEDAVLVGQVAAYYQERLKQSPPALDYLASRGLDEPGLIERYQLGYADRSLGLRMPDSNRKEGETLRVRLTQLGLWRESGHEHFNGCLVVPLFDETGRIVNFYGRRIGKGTVSHLYSPGPHRGLFNREAFQNEEVILCEAALDALTFCAAGIHNVSTIYGTEGFTEEHAKALKHVRRVKLAYDADDAGERAAMRDAERLKALGIDVWRLKVPWGMDVNEYARKVTPAGKSLPLLVNAAQWMGNGKAPVTVEVPAFVPVVEVETVVPVVAEPSEIKAEQAPEVEEKTEAVALRAPAPSSSLAAFVSGSEEATKKEKAATVPVVPVLSERDGHWWLVLEEREYRVSGLGKCLGSGGESLKVTLRVKSRDYFHSDQLDLCRDGDRRRFVERAVEETGLTPELLKRDLGRLLLAVEQYQEERLRQERAAALGGSIGDRLVQLEPKEEAEALEFLRSPDLLGKIGQAFEQCGVVGETNNKLTAYLACMSRKLERPLAIIIQSTSAAGKTSLMEAVLSFFPEEERVKYSAMTGQSLYYLGESNLKHKILAIVEEEGAEKASYALKLLQSEGELKIASTGKDPNTGRMVTQEYKVEGPVMIFLTTTAIDIDEELMNRCLILTVDESSEQTARIHALQRQKRTLAGLIASEKRKDVLRVLQNAQRLLVPMKVLNPFAPDLTFGSERTRTRRDNEKYLTLIDSIALLHQHQRQRGSETVNGRVVEYIEVTMEDIETANRLAKEVLGRSLDELPPQSRRLYEEVRALVRELMEKNSQPQSRSFFSRRQLRDKSGLSEFQVRMHLQRLEELEYVSRRFGRQGASCVYELLCPVDLKEGPYVVGLLDVEALRASLGERHDYKENFEGEKESFEGTLCEVGHEVQKPQIEEIEELSGSLRDFGQTHIRTEEPEGIVA